MAPPKPSSAGKDKRLSRQRKGGKDAAPQPEGDAPASDAARIEVLTAQLDAANARIEDADKRNNYLLLERDMVEGYYHIARGDLEAAERTGRLKDVDLEAAEDQHLIEQKELRQRIRHLSYGHGRAVIKLKQEGDAALRAAADAEARRQAEDYQEKAALRRLNREQAIKHQEWTAALQVEHGKTAAKQRGELQAAAADLEAKFAAAAAAAAQEAALRLRVEVSEVEERRGDYTRSLIAQHEQAMATLKALYEGALAERLELARAARAEAAAATGRAEVAEAEVAELRAEHEGMSAPLAQAQGEVAVLRLRVAALEQDAEELLRVRRQEAAARHKLKALEWEHELSALQRRSHSKAAPPASHSRSVPVAQQPVASPAAAMQPVAALSQPAAEAAKTALAARPLSAVLQRQQAPSCAAELLRSSSARLASPQLASGLSDG